MRVRSLVGLIPLLAVDTIDGDQIWQRMADFQHRIDWFIENRPNLCQKRRRYVRDRPP